MEYRRDSSCRISRISDNTIIVRIYLVAYGISCILYYFRPIDRVGLKIYIRWNAIYIYCTSTCILWSVIMEVIKEEVVFPCFSIIKVNRKTCPCCLKCIYLSATRTDSLYLVVVISSSYHQSIVLGGCSSYFESKICLFNWEVDLFEGSISSICIVKGSIQRNNNLNSWDFFKDVSIFKS